MYKQLILILSIITIFGASVLAQDKPENSHKCCGTKDAHSEVNLEKSSESASLQIWNKVCPVKGEEIDVDAPTVEYNGKVIGFCCPGCDTKFQKDPEKYLKNLNENGSKFIVS